MFIDLALILSVIENSYNVEPLFLVYRRKKKMFCEKCGAENLENSMFCQECGAPLENIPPNNTWTNERRPAQIRYMTPEIPEEYKPIGMWGYLGYQILFAIPIVGFIMLLVFSLGGTTNVNLKNFARSYFCMTIIVLVLALILVMIGAISILS